MVKLIKRAFPITIIVVIFIFLIRHLILNWAKIPFDELYFNGFLLAISFLALFLDFMFYSKSWQEIMRVLDRPISFSQSSWMIATTQIAKYLPGRIWYMIGRIYVGKREKLDGRSLAVSMVLETCLLLISSGTIFLISTAIIGDYSIVNLFIGVIFVVVAVVVINPRVLSWITNFFLRILKKPEVTIRVSYMQMLRLSTYFFLLWIAQIIGFYFLITAMYPLPLSKFFVLSSAYTISWIVGFIAVIVPGGLGVREGIMTLMLSQIVPMPMAIAISFITRVWVTLYEVTLFFAGLLIKKHAVTSSHNT